MVSVQFYPNSQGTVELIRRAAMMSDGNSVRRNAGMARTIHPCAVVSWPKQSTNSRVKRQSRHFGRPRCCCSIEPLWFPLVRVTLCLLSVFEVPSSSAPMSPAVYVSPRVESDRTSVLLTLRTYTYVRACIIDQARSFRCHWRQSMRASRTICVECCFPTTATHQNGRKEGPIRLSRLAVAPWARMGEVGSTSRT